jgi:hypothetical protein
MPSVAHAASRSYSALTGAGQCASCGSRIPAVSALAPDTTVTSPAIGRTPMVQRPRRQANRTLDEISRSGVPSAECGRGEHRQRVIWTTVPTAGADRDMVAIQIREVRSRDGIDRSRRLSRNRSFAVRRSRWLEDSRNHGIRAVTCRLTSGHQQGPPHRGCRHDQGRAAPDSVGFVTSGASGAGRFQHYDTTHFGMFDSASFHPPRRRNSLARQSTSHDAQPPRHWIIPEPDASLSN